MTINFHGLNVSEDNIECESFIVISIDSLVVYKNKLPASLLRQLNLENCKQTNGYLDDNLLEDYIL